MLPLGRSDEGCTSFFLTTTCSLLPKRNATMLHKTLGMRNRRSSTRSLLPFGAGPCKMSRWWIYQPKQMPAVTKARKSVLLTLLMFVSEQSLSHLPIPVVIKLRRRLCCRHSGRLQRTCARIWRPKLKKEARLMTLLIITLLEI